MKIEWEESTGFRGFDDEDGEIAYIVSFFVIIAIAATILFFWQENKN